MGSCYSCRNQQYKKHGMKHLAGCMRCTILHMPAESRVWNIVCRCAQDIHDVAADDSVRVHALDTCGIQTAIHAHMCEKLVLSSSQHAASLIQTRVTYAMYCRMLVTHGISVL